MTIALGVLATDGIVVATDTQITIGAGKTTMGKMGAAVQYQESVLGSCIVAGAGSVTHMSNCSRTLVSSFLHHPTLVKDELQAVFANDLHEFHGEHIVPFAQFPEDDRPYVEFIIGYERDGYRSLWKTDRTVVEMGEPYAAIGHGQQQALSILNKLYRMPPLDIWGTMMLAFYVLARVKESDIYCGGRTEVLFIRDNHLRDVPRRLASRIDGAMERYGQVIEANTFRDVIGSAPSAAASQEGEVRELFTGFVNELQSSLGGGG